MVLAGDLRERVTIERLEVRPDGSGGQFEHWVFVAEVAAKVQPVGGREQITGGALQSSPRWAVTIRRRSALTVRHRLLWAGRVLDIQSIAPDATRTWQVLDCEGGNRLQVREPIILAANAVQQSVAAEANLQFIADDADELLTEVATGGITFDFTGPLHAWQFALGDWGVDISGGGGVAWMNPPAVQESRVTTTGQVSPVVLWNGAMLCPASPDKILARPDEDGAEQGFMQWKFGHHYQPDWYAPWCVDPAFTGEPVTQPGCLVKMITQNPPLGGTATAAGRNTQQEYASLFLVDGRPPTPAPDAYFCPPQQHYAPAIWIKAKDADGYAIDIDMFPALSGFPASPAAPSFASLWPRLSRLHLTAWWNHGVSRNLYATAQQPNYGRDYSELTSNAAQHMCLDRLPLDERYRLGLGLTQIGVHLAGLVNSGARHNSVGMGNTSTGRKICLAVAAVVTGSAYLEDALALAIQARCFVEDKQMQPVAIGDTAYPPELWGRIEWNDGDPPPDGGDFWVWDNVSGSPSSRVRYRHNWMVAQRGAYNALQVVPELKAAWDNPDFFDYCWRYWTVEQARGFAGQNATDSLDRGGRFFRMFQQTFPAYFPAGPWH